MEQLSYEIRPETGVKIKLMENMVAIWATSHFLELKN